MAKVLALVPPRADGTVTADFTVGQGRGAKLKRYIFQPDGAGNLVADVEDKDHLEQMLKNPANFRRLASSAEMRAEAEAKEKAEAERKKQEAKELAEAERRERAEAEADAKKK